MKQCFLVFSAIVVLVSMMAGSPVSGSAQDPSSACADSEEAELLKLINTYRLANGQQPFTFSQSLSVAAEVHSRDMATNNFLGHTGSNGSTFSQRIADAGYAEPATSGENVFAGDPTAAGAFGWWQNSPGHNASMLSPSYAAIGIARVHNPDSTFQWYWTTTFGQTPDASACVETGPAAVQPETTGTEQPQPQPSPTEVETPQSDTETQSAAPAANAPAETATVPENVQPTAEPASTQTDGPGAGGDQPVAEQPTPTAAEQSAPAAGSAETPPAGATDTSDQTATGGQPASGCAADSEELALLSLINDHRAQNGAPPLSLGPTLSAAADTHSQDMAANDFLGHSGSNGSTLPERLIAAGYPAPNSVGEYVFAGDPAASGAFAFWQGEARTNEDLLNPGHVAIGIARANNPNSTFSWYWTITLGGTVETTNCGGTPPPGGGEAAAGPTFTPAPESTTETTGEEQPASGPAAADAAAAASTEQPTATTSDPSTGGEAQPTTEPAAVAVATEASADQSASQPTAAVPTATEANQPPAQPTASQDAAAQPTAAAGGAASCADVEELALLALINDYRAQNGAQPYALSPGLSAAADAHSQDMATNNIFSHTGSDGSNFVQRMVAAGYPEAEAAGENIFAGGPNADGVFNGWKNSPPHNAAMLNPNLGAIGIARVSNPAAPDTWLWTATFGVSVEANTCGAASVPADTGDGGAEPTPDPANTVEEGAENAAQPPAEDAADGQAAADQDGDGLTDADEATFGTNPDLSDSDGDGIGDGEEINTGTDPLDSASV